MAGAVTGDHWWTLEKYDVPDINFPGGYVEEYRIVKH